MLPIVGALLGTLAQNGLGLLASAIQAKGKEFVEDKLGVTIPDDPTPADVDKLRQMQFDHEERLIELGIQKASQELDAFKEEVKDRGSARDRDAWFVRMGKHNFRADAMVLVAAGAVALLVFMVWRQSDVNEYVKGIITLVLGRFLGYLDNIYNFEFGTTRGSQNKDETIKQLSGGK